MELGEGVKKLKSYLFMVLLQFGFAGMYVISVATLKQGMSHYVLGVYRNAVAAVVLAPFAFWFERKGRPKMTLPIFLKITALAILEPVLDQNFYCVGAKLTSASFAAPLYNILPAVTFAMAIILGMERIKLNSRHSQAKMMGTLITVAGALVMILYRGPVVEFFWSKGRSHHSTDAGVHDQSQWLKGTLMLILSCFCWASFFILQANTLKSYPSELSLATLICSMGTVLGAAVTLVVERGSKPWVIGWDTRLFTPVYTGVICSGIAYYVQGVVMKERGPVFVTAFNPLCMIIVAVLGSVILAEDITMGMVVGAIIIVIGIYALIWGKSKDHLNPIFDIDDKNGAVKLPVDMMDTGRSNSN